MDPTTILIVDDDELIRIPIAMGLRHAGYQVLQASDGKTAHMLMQQEEVDLSLLDFQLPDTTGFELLAALREHQPDTVAIMMTAHATVERAVEAMRLGAFHYVTKPVGLEQLLVLVDKALETTRLRRDLRRLQSDRSRPYSVESIIGESPAMQQVKGLLGKIARSPASTVLLLGESGTGKGLAARVIHHNSARSERPFMNITCSTLPGPLLESELFGHERGAFTDAKQQKKGLMEQADGGTVFLDEFTEMEPVLQAKLLRFLEEKAFRRVGGNKDIQVDVRLIGATNRDMDEAVREGILRKDLYYRLQVLTVRLPPLRERTGDILTLAKGFVEQYNKEFAKEVRGISAGALRVLETHPWEGNVRELRNAVERAMLFAEEHELQPDDFAALTPADALEGGFRLPPGGLDLDELERGLVVQALARSRGNRTRAATLLGLSRDQIRYRIEKFGLE